MKHLQLVGLISLLFLSVISCGDDDRSIDFIEGVAPPSNVTLSAIVSNDNTGRVTLAPSATSAASFVIDFGDGSEISPSLFPGQSIDHIYPEGSYTTMLTAINSLGETATISQDIDVDFIAPSNLSFEVSISPSNLFEVTVSPTADNASGFEVYFGEDPAATPQIITTGEAAIYEYQSEGVFDIRVVAFNGGVTQIEATQSITIESPDRVLPLTFEDVTVDYGIFGFEGADSMVITNPVASGINTSSRVVETIKTQGAQFFAGTVIPLEVPIDFSQTQKIAIKVYSPKANIPVRLKLETASGGSEFMELDQNTTVENQWEELVWDFSGNPQIDLDYVQIVLFFEFIVDLPGDGSTYYFDDITLAN